MAQPPRHPMSLYRRSHRLAHHQPDSRAGRCSSHRCACTTRSRSTARIPSFTVDTELRRPCHPVSRRKHRPGYPSRLRQSVSVGPCAAGWTRSRARRGSSSEAGIRAPAHACGCSAGRSACPWPRQYLLVRLAPRRLPHRLTTHAEADAVAVGKLFVSLTNRRGPRGRTASDRCRIADFRATVRGY